MGTKLTIILLILGSFLITTLGSNPETHWPNADDSGCTNLCLGKEKETKLRFYLHDVLSGDNATVVTVAKSNLTDILPTKFGLVVVLDDIITSEPDIHSKQIGRLQGVVARTDLREELVLTLLVNVLFTEGEYKGSTLSIVGRNPLGDETREVSVVGGSGAFRMARGYAILRTLYLDEQRYALFQYNVVVYHYSMDDVTSF